MTIRYEANPPKILPDVNKDKSIEKFVEKIKTISKKCDAIHLTENVLGHERVSPLEIGKILKMLKSSCGFIFEVKTTVTPTLHGENDTFR